MAGRSGTRAVGARFQGHLVRMKKKREEMAEREMDAL